MMFDESFGDLEGLNERILKGVVGQRSNDPLPSLLLENDYGRITLELRSGCYQFFFMQKNPFFRNPRRFPKPVPSSRRSFLSME